MVWDKNKPENTSCICKGDDAIRELKSDLEKAFKTEFSSLWQPDKSIHHLFAIPELGLENQIRLREYGSSNLCTLDIFLNNQWNKGTQLVDFSVDSLLISFSNQSFFGWQTYNLATDYMLVIGDIVISNSSGYSLTETISHHHGFSENKETGVAELIHRHSPLSISIKEANQGVHLNILWQTGNVWKVSHTHEVEIISNIYIGNNHYHICFESPIGSFNTHFGKIIKKTI